MHTYYVYVYNNLCKFYLPALFIIFICRVKRQQGRQEESQRNGGERDEAGRGEADKKQKKRWQTSVGSILIKPQAVDMLATYAQTHAHAHTETHRHVPGAHTHFVEGKESN